MKRKETHFKFPMNEMKASDKNNTQACTMTISPQYDNCYI